MIQKFAFYVNKIHRDMKETTALWESTQKGEVKDVLKGLTTDLFSDNEESRYDIGKNKKPHYFFKFLEQNPDIFKNLMTTEAPIVKKKSVAPKVDESQEKSPFDKYLEISEKRQAAKAKLQEMAKE